MSTKAQIQAKIDAIADGEENTAEEVREFANGLLDEMWNDTIYDTQSLSIITSGINAFITYGINFTKQGNIVNVQGAIVVSPSGIIFAGTDLIAFTEAEYLPKGTIIQNFKKDGAIFRFNDGKIRAITALTSGTTYYIDLAYVTD